MPAGRKSPCPQTVRECPRLSAALWGRQDVRVVRKLNQYITSKKTLGIRAFAACPRRNLWNPLSAGLCQNLLVSAGHARLKQCHTHGKIRASSPKRTCRCVWPRTIQPCNRSDWDGIQVCHIPGSSIWCLFLPLLKNSRIVAVLAEKRRSWKSARTLGRDLPDGTRKRLQVYLGGGGGAFFGQYLLFLIGRDARLQKTL